MVGRFSSNSVVWVVFVLLMLVEGLEDQDGEDNGAEERVDGKKVTMPDGEQDRKLFDGLTTSNRQSGTTSEGKFMSFEEVFKLMEERSEMLKEDILDHNSCDPILYPKANIITTLLEIVNGFSMPGAGTTEYCSYDLFNGPITILSKVEKRLVLKPQYVDQPQPSRASRKYSLLAIKTMVKEGSLPEELKETLLNSAEDAEDVEDVDVEEDTIFIYTIDEDIEEDLKKQPTQPLGTMNGTGPMNASLYWRNGTEPMNTSMYWRNGTEPMNTSMYWRNGTEPINASMYWRNGTGPMNVSMYWRNGTGPMNVSMYWRNGTGPMNSSMYWRNGTRPMNVSMYWRNGTGPMNVSMYWRNGTGPMNVAMHVRNGTGPMNASMYWRNSTGPKNESMYWRYSTGPKNASMYWKNGTGPKNESTIYSTSYSSMTKADSSEVSDSSDNVATETADLHDDNMDDRHKQPNNATKTGQHHRLIIKG